MVLRGYDIHWRMWATWISSQPNPTHQALINECPPANLIHLFQRAPTDSDVVLQQLNHSATLVQNIVDLVNPILQELISLERQAMDFRVRRVEHLQASLSAHLNSAAFFGRMSAANEEAAYINPADIVNQEDVDHMQQ